MGIINDYGFPFTSVNNDRTYSSGDWREYFVSLFSNGVVDGNLNKLQIKPQAVPNKTIFVDTGSIIINGAVLSNTSTKTLSIAENTSGNSRIDRIVARLNLTDRKISFAVVQGTPAASPSAPALTRNTTTYEMSLAQILLTNGYSTIVSENITDERLNEAVCGYSKTVGFQSSINDLISKINALNTRTAGLIPSDNILLEYLTEAAPSVQSNQWSTIKTVKLLTGGRIRLTGEIRGAGSGAYTFIRIIVGGVYIAPTASTTSTTYVTFSVDTDFIVPASSLLVIQVGTNTWSNPAYKNLRIRGSISTTQTLFTDEGVVFV